MGLLHCLMGEDDLLRHGHQGLRDAVAGLKEGAFQGMSIHGQGCQGEDIGVEDGPFFVFRLTAPDGQGHLIDKGNQFGMHGGSASGMFQRVDQECLALVMPLSAAAIMGRAGHMGKGVKHPGKLGKVGLGGTTPFPGFQILEKNPAGRGNYVSPGPVQGEIEPRSSRPTRMTVEKRGLSAF